MPSLSVLGRRSNALAAIAGLRTGEFILTYTGVATSDRESVFKNRKSVVVFLGSWGIESGLLEEDVGALARCEGDEAERQCTLQCGDVALAVPAQARVEQVLGIL